MKLYCLYEHFYENFKRIKLKNSITTISILPNTPCFISKSYCVNKKEFVEFNMLQCFEHNNISVETNDNINQLDKHIINNFRLANLCSNEKDKYLERLNTNIKRSKKIFEKREIVLANQTYFYYKIFNNLDTNRTIKTVIFFTAFFVKTEIWGNIIKYLPDDYLIYIIDSEISLNSFVDITTRIFEIESIKEAVGISWCSGFKSMIKVANYLPNILKKLISITGNYSDTFNKESLSNYEISLNTIAGLVLNNFDQTKNNLLTSLSNSFSNNKYEKYYWNVEKTINEMISYPLHNESLIFPYMNMIEEYSKQQTRHLLNDLKIPMLNIIAADDIVSSFENNYIMNVYKGEVTNLILPFSSHWCIWLNAKQISELIVAFIKDE